MLPLSLLIHLFALTTSPSQRESAQEKCCTQDVFRLCCIKAACACLQDLPPIFVQRRQKQTHIQVSGFAEAKWEHGTA